MQDAAGARESGTDITNSTLYSVGEKLNNIILLETSIGLLLGEPDMGVVVIN